MEEKVGKTYADIAHEVGVSRAYISQVLHGKRPPSKKLIPYLNILRPKTISDYYKARDSSWEDHLEAIKSIDKLVAFHERVPLEIVVEIPARYPIAVCFTADWQIGQPGVDYDAWQADILTLATERALYGYIGGDTCQNIIQESKMGSAHHQIPISIQKGVLVLTYKMLLNSILAIGTGNHNYWSALKEGEDWDAELAHRLNLIYTKHGGMLHLKVGKQVYPILRMHESRFNSSFNDTHSAKQNQRMYFPDARIIVIEHQHVAAIEQYRYNQKECVAIRTGTYAVYDDYAQQHGFWGAHVGNPTVVLYPNEDRIVGFKDMHDAIIYLRAVRAKN